MISIPDPEAKVPVAMRTFSNDRPEAGTGNTGIGAKHFEFTPGAGAGSHPGTGELGVGDDTPQSMLDPMSSAGGGLSRGGRGGAGRRFEFGGGAGLNQGLLAGITSRGSSVSMASAMGTGGGGGDEHGGAGGGGGGGDEHGGGLGVRGALKRRRSAVMAVTPASNSEFGETPSDAGGRGVSRNFNHFPDAAAASGTGTGTGTVGGRGRSVQPAGGGAKSSWAAGYDAGIGDNSEEVDGEGNDEDGGSPSAESGSEAHSSHEETAKRRRTEGAIEL